VNRNCFYFGARRSACLCNVKCLACAATYRDPKQERVEEGYYEHGVRETNRPELALTLPTSGGRSVDTVRSRTQATEF
jgi:hypothetical protein